MTTEYVEPDPALVDALAALSPDALASVLGDAVRKHADPANHPERDRSTAETAGYLLADDETEITIGYRWDSA